MKPNEGDWQKAALVCREVAELSDRSSPELTPDEMIVTGDELAPMVAFALAEARKAESARLKTELAAICQTCLHAIEASPRYASGEREAIEHCLGVIRAGFDRVMTTDGSRVS